MFRCDGILPLLAHRSEIQPGQNGPICNEILIPYPAGAMRDEVGEDFRTAFLETLEVAGTECDVHGERRRALKQTKKKEGYVVLQFADEFAIEVGDRFMETATETRFDVVDVESVSVAGVFQHFEVTAERVT